MLKKSFVIWLTGLSGAGKTTIAMQVEKALRTRGLGSKILDGDIVRNGLCKDLGFSDEDRSEKEAGDQEHRKGLDGPVEKESEQDRLSGLARSDPLSKIDLDHDGIHHEEETDRDGNRDHRRAVDRQRHPVEGFRQARCKVAQGHTDDDTEPDP